MYFLTEAGFKNGSQIFDSAIPHKGTTILSYGSFMSHDIITKDVFKTSGLQQCNVVNWAVREPMISTSPYIIGLHSADYQLILIKLLLDRLAMA